MTPLLDKGQYPEEFRKAMAYRYLLGERCQDLADEYNVTSQSIYGWARKLKKELEEEDAKSDM